MTDASRLTPTVLILAPPAGYLTPALGDLLGPDRCAALEAELHARTVRWAEGVAPGKVEMIAAGEGAADPHAGGASRAEDVASTPGAARGDTPAEARGDTNVRSGLARAATLLRAGAGPVLIVRPIVPRLAHSHASAALADLEEGCDVVVGPTLDGGFYLIGIARWKPEMAELGGADDGHTDVISAGAALAHGAGLELGILRAERPLQRPADVRAALADPLLPDGLARILRRRD